jgi:hypothetical protein
VLHSGHGDGLSKDVKHDGPALLTAAGQGAIKQAMKTPFAIIGICIIG